MKLPFNRSYWADPGRLLAGFYPGDEDSGTADRKLTGLLECGVSHIINLMEADEVNRDGKRFASYESRFRELGEKRGIITTCRRFPIVDQSTPSVADMRVILDELVELTSTGTAYVHCWGGRGRTGTVVGCYLRRMRGLTGAEALSLLAELTAHEAGAFGRTPEMACQRKFVEQWREY
jgi:hypothetical protein